MTSDVVDQPDKHGTKDGCPGSIPRDPSSARGGLRMTWDLSTNWISTKSSRSRTAGAALSWTRITPGRDCRCGKRRSEVAIFLPQLCGAMIQPRNFIQARGKGKSELGDFLPHLCGNIPPLLDFPQQHSWTHSLPFISFLNVWI